MFKSEYAHLFVRPGQTIWTIANKLNKEPWKHHSDPPPFRFYLHGGRASHSCPAHPSSSLDQQGDSNNWVNDNRVKVGVLLRCATHDAVHNKWLFEQAMNGNIPKEKVGALLCEEDKDGSFFLSVWDNDVQQRGGNMESRCD